MLFAETAHPYNDPEDPWEWAWRFGYYELLYIRSLKMITLSRRPKYSIRGPQHCCPHCNGSDYLSSPGTSLAGHTDAKPRCPKCPKRRVLLDHIPIWPVRTIDRLRAWRLTHRRPRVRHIDAWETGQGPASYTDEPPF
ncbi:hypothetical protein [Streptomyces sp. SCL15-6]|uniref:hypothetical protein n=1 Tax=Streptomyces sp. SCL15-6 TaxID=2967222 RepID=UPI002966D4E0|nr:hypothetical protein [Streptomyces sp. SCL15-6]